MDESTDRMLKAVILIGGAQKGTRFRPLSLDIPKPLFPVAGVPMIQHHIEAFSKVPGLKEIIILGYYPLSELSSFVSQMMKKYDIHVRYLQEYASLGTAGGIYHFRDQIRSGNPQAFFVVNGDVCGDLPYSDLLTFHLSRPNGSLVTILSTEATRQQAMNYGCVVEDKETHQVLHYVEKPSTFVSNLINCGVYVCSPGIFGRISTVFKKKQDEYYSDEAEVTNNKDMIQLEQEILMPLTESGQLYVYQTTKWWSQIKTAGSAIYANRHYLELYRRLKSSRLASSVEPQIVGDVFIHPSASVHPSAVLGPNVSIGQNVTIGPGVRIRESIILGNTQIQDHSLVLYSIVGWNSVIGAWSRVEGTPCDPNPNKPFAKMENVSLFNEEGKMNPSITILGGNVTIPPEIIVLNAIVLPDKDISRSYKNEIIL